MIQYKAFSEKCGREINEDAFCIYQNKEIAVFVLCDGLGGHEAGEVASALISTSITNFFQNHSIQKLSSDIIMQSIRHAENQLQKRAEEIKQYEMGTTLALLAADKKQIYVSWVGDSKVYLWNKQQLLFQTEDHSLVNLLVKSGEITEEEAEQHPKKNVILRSINPTQPCKPDIHQIPLRQVTHFLLTSDGLLNIFKNQKIQTLWQQFSTLEEAYHHLHSAALQSTADNTTSIIGNIMSQKNICSFFFQ